MDRPGLSPPPNSREELAAFARLQERFPDMYREVFADPKTERTIVVVPSMSLDERELAKIPGVIHYEERMLGLLMFLKLPRTQVVYVTSTPLDPSVIDYYLRLLPGVSARDARERLQLMSIGDSSLTPLSAKLLSRPQMLDTLKEMIRFPNAAHITCFNSTPMERTLAVQLEIPLYACDPALAHLGNKSRSRSVFRDVGLRIPPGVEDLRARDDLIEALVELAAAQPHAEHAVVKLNEGFSGEGNALAHLGPIRESVSPHQAAEEILTEGLEFEAEGETWDAYEQKFEGMGGIVELLIEREGSRSPSVQMRIDPLGEIHLISTHDQVLSGPSGQVYLGCTFPAHEDYRSYLHEAGHLVAKDLKSYGVLGRFGVDFVSTPGGNGWNHYAIEINLRKGGTTVPYLMLEFLTGGSYDGGTGEFHTLSGDVRCYYATDNMVRDSYVGLTPEELVKATVHEDLRYDTTRQEGPVFHMLGSVTDQGKLGVVSIAGDLSSAEKQYEAVVSALDDVTA